jgi:predicted dehydrogenase
MPDNDESTVSRRELLGRGSALALGLLMGSASGLHAEELIPEAPLSAFVPDEQAAAAPVSVAVIGLGDQGRALLTSLSYVPGANVLYICDNYTTIHKRAQEIAPKATVVDDYKKVLSDLKVQAVYVATPSHLHKQIVLDALAAGKHVYCEAPLASSIEDAKAIATAAKAAAPKVIFHSGLQYRTNPQHHHVLNFVRTGALAKVAQAKACWHKKTSWRKTAPTDERQNALNWRLNRATSAGLSGELGIHQIDITTWYMNARPTAVSGFGSVVVWNDGRNVPDTVQAIIEYPGGVRLAYDATLANSYDGVYELLQGTDAAVLMRDQRAWMFKEADATALGWEVYAYKEKIGDDTGIALVADATKLLADGKQPGENRNTDPRKSALYYASEAFLNAIRTGKANEDADFKVGYEATVIAIKTNEAILAGSRIPLTPEMFAI